MLVDVPGEVDREDMGVSIAVVKRKSQTASTKWQSYEIAANDADAGCAKPRRARRSPT